MLTSHERITRMFDHKEADRVPVNDGPWQSTIERWQREGMPTDVAIDDYFGMDKVVGIGADNSPRLPAHVIEETDEWVKQTTSWGATLRNWKHAGGVPEFLDFTIKDPASWAQVKERMTPDRDRVDWDYLARNYKSWREQGAWIDAGLWFGFDVTHAWIVGTERILMAMVEQPEWVVDMFTHELEVQLALFDMVWEAGYHFDGITWPDDMGYKYNTFFSLATYRNLLKPVHKKACDWARAKGVRTHLHSCGCITPFIPDLIDAGIEMLNPLEVKAGINPVELKRIFGDRLAFHGGLNAVLFNEPQQLWNEMHAVIPRMKENGGYWISSDHSVPDSVSLDMFREFMALAKKLGSYE
jgi:uroporphyrinogen decarboxylase